MNSNYLRLLIKYGILVEDEEGWVDNLERIANRQDGETFKQWKTRIFKENVEGLRVYYPCEPAPNKTMSILREEAGSRYLIKAFKNFREMADEEAKASFDEATASFNEEKAEIINRFSTISMDLIQEILDENEAELEDSIVEFLHRYLHRTDKSVSTKEILTELIRRYSAAVTRCRQDVI